MPASVVGRGTESQVATQFLDGLRGGSGVLLLSGEPGIGKTSLWTAVVEQAHRFPCRILTARPARAETKLAFAALSDLLADIDDDVLGLLPEPQRRALAVALLREDPGGRRHDQRVISAATLSVLTALSRSGPVVVAVDDVQWIDRPSARVLEFAVRRLADQPVGVIACHRVGGSADAPLDLERLVAPDRLTRIRLGPLDDGSLSQIIEGQLGRPLPPRTLTRLLTVARGNPFFAVEFARAVALGDTPGPDSLPMPRNLQDLVDARLAILPARTRVALLVVSALRSPTVELVALGMGASSLTAHRALKLAQTAAVVALDRDSVGVAFSHPLFAAGVYDAATPKDRRRVHRRVAQSSLGTEERARHLALGTAGADGELAYLLDTAAEQARSRGAPEIAANLAEHALRLTPTGRTDDAMRRTIAVAEFRFHAGEVGPARRMLEDVLTRATTRRSRADASRALGELRYHQDSFAEALELFRRALDEVGDEPGIVCQIQLHMTFAAVAAGDFGGAQSHAHQALILSERIDSQTFLSHALAVVAITDFMVGEGLDEDRLRRALELEDPFAQMGMALRPSLIAGCIYLYQGRLEESVRILEQVRAGVIERGDESNLPFVSSCLAWAECWHGRLDAAAAYAQEALDTATRLETASAECIALAYGAVVEAYRGDAERARTRAERTLLLARQTGFGNATAWAGWALGILGLELGEPVAADDALGPMTQFVERDGLAEPVRGMFVADEIEALVALEQLDRAERLIDILEESGTRHTRAWAIVGAQRGRALLWAARGDLEAASRSAASALEWCGDLELELEVARTLLVAGHIERRRKRRRAARELLEDALQRFESAGAALWAKRARLELERVTARREQNALTTTERLVADLSASGLTNREVAVRLHISPKTVESNLSRVYLKLGIRSRAELGSRLAPGSETDATP